jgi:hypothetical protein
MNKYFLLALISIGLVGCGGKEETPIEGGGAENESPIPGDRGPVTTTSPIIEGLSLHKGPDLTPEIIDITIESGESIEINTKVTGELEFQEFNGNFIELAFSHSDGSLVAIILSEATDTTEMAIYSDEVLAFYEEGSMDKEIVFYAEPGINYMVHAYDSSALERANFSLTVSTANRSTLSLTHGQYYVKTAVSSMILCTGDSEARSHYREYLEVWDFLDNSMVYSNQSIYNPFDSIIDNVIIISATDTEESTYATRVNSWARNVTINPIENEFHGTMTSNTTNTIVGGNIKECSSTGTIEGHVVL